MATAADQLGAGAGAGVNAWPAAVEMPSRLSEVLDASSGQGGNEAGECVRQCAERASPTFVRQHGARRLEPCEVGRMLEQIVKIRLTDVEIRQVRGDLIVTAPTL